MGPECLVRGSARFVGPRLSPRLHRGRRRTLRGSRYLPRPRRRRRQQTAGGNRSIPDRLKQYPECRLKPRPRRNGSRQRRSNRSSGNRNPLPLFRRPLRVQFLRRRPRRQHRSRQISRFPAKHAVTPARGLAKIHWSAQSAVGCVRCFPATSSIARFSCGRRTARR